MFPFWPNDRQPSPKNPAKSLLAQYSLPVFAIPPTTRRLNKPRVINEIRLHNLLRNTWPQYICAYCPLKEDTPEKYCVPSHSPLLITVIIKVPMAMRINKNRSLVSALTRTGSGGREVSLKLGSHRRSDRIYREKRLEYIEKALFQCIKRYPRKKIIRSDRSNVQITTSNSLNCP